MIDATATAASWFLWIAPGFFLVAYAVPLLVAPFRWARLFGWTVNERDDLALYFARCLGALAIAVCFACMRVAPHASAHAVLFELIGAAGGLLAFVHILGALEKRQPWAETAEIVLYLGVTIAALALRPG